MKTLIVEDEFTNRLLLQKLLAPYGESNIAINGKEAIFAFRSALDSGAPYSLICLDIMMPEMDGREALKLIREIEQERGILSTDGVRIFMTTALGDLKSIANAFQDLCDGYLIKPIKQANLLTLLKEHGLVEDAA